MNGQHLRAFFWLRWRLFINQMKRGGIANAVILAVLAAAGVLSSVFMFLVLFLVGLILLPEASPTVILYVGDGLVLAFLFFWIMGIVTELQRAEALALDKFLHLPVSLTSAFVINYLSSLLSLTMILFLPAMVGLGLGLVLGRGPAMLLLFPLGAAFLLMITALTYQLQGWLASLMANKRRRQTIIVMVTMGMILACQLPNMLNILRPWSSRQPTDAIDLPHLQEQNRQTQATLEWTTQVLNYVLPPGWLPLGAECLAEGDFVPALLGTLGMALIGSASLWRAYGTTVRFYTGQFNSGQKQAATAPPPPLDHTPAYFFERKLPRLSEQATAIALASFRSLLRAPEAKMLLLSPLIMVVVFGSMFMMQTNQPPANIRPLFPFGGMAMVLFGMIAFVGNQFGFDRNGFRVYVLSPARRQDILLGKNLAIAPLAVGLGLVLAILLELIFPLRLDHLLALPAQLISMFLVFCVMGNWLSIIAPVAIPAGSFKAAKPRGLAILLNIAFVFLFPIALLPTLLPLGIEALLHGLGYLENLPICLVLTLLEFVGIAFLYRLVLTWQGNVLQEREQRILELVTVKSD